MEGCSSSDSLTACCCCWAEARAERSRCASCESTADMSPSSSPAGTPTVIPCPLMPEGNGASADEPCWPCTAMRWAGRKRGGCCNRGGDAGSVLAQAVRNFGAARLDASICRQEQESQFNGAATAADWMRGGGVFVTAAAGDAADDAVSIRTMPEPWVWNTPWRGLQVKYGTPARSKLSSVRFRPPGKALRRTKDGTVVTPGGLVELNPKPDGSFSDIKIWSNRCWEGWVERASRRARGGPSDPPGFPT
jgi:hypothetical protein